MNKKFFNEYSNFIILSILFISAFLVRMTLINSIDFLPMKQTMSLIESRNFFYNLFFTDINQNLLISNAQMLQIAPRELPIIEYFFGFIYYIIGKEVIIFPKIFSVLSWIIAGLFLYKILNKFFSFYSCFLSVAIFLHLPFGVLLSRSFLTEPFLILLLSISVYYIIVFKESENIFNLLPAAIPCFLISLFKIDYIILICFFYLFYSFFKDGVKGSLSNIYNYIFALISCSSLLFYFDNMFYNDNFGGFLLTQFNFYLLFNISFWLGWIAQISIVTIKSIFSTY